MEEGNTKGGTAEEKEGAMDKGKGGYANYRRGPQVKKRARIKGHSSQGGELNVEK